MKNLLVCSIILFLLSSVNAQNLITVDAERDAFFDGLTNPDDGKIFMPAAAFISTINPNGPAGNEDLSATIWTAWDDTYIYYYAEVNDDTIRVTTESGGSDWSNDKIEVKFDPDPSLPDAQNGVIQVGLAALDSTEAQNPLAVDNMNQDNELQLPDGTIWASTPDDYARKVTDNDNVLEFSIPNENLNKGDRQILWPPTPGLIIGMTINVADNDSIARTNMLQWSAGFDDLAWSWPRFQGSVQFLEDNKLKFEAINFDGTLVNDSAEVWYYTPISSVRPDQISNVPASFNLAQNYPNPFNPSTKIRYSLEKADNVTLTIYNINGEAVRNLLSGLQQNAGTHEVTWDAKDNSGNKVSSGVYFYKMKTGSIVTSKKMILMQ
ncbi:T9SS C-terminal target domain-containing protein [bacterium]|nr:MAG: T9SS C-terminal target domain-containing protein [bacterium]